MWYKNKVAWCPICNQGWVEIFKDKITNLLFVCCDECEALWEHPDFIKEVDLATSTFDFEYEIVEPSEEEINIRGWDKYIIND
jgi:transcription elongation factor Elf1